jgi:hypothetical protein
LQTKPLDVVSARIDSSTLHNREAEGCDTTLPGPSIFEQTKQSEVSNKKSKKRKVMFADLLEPCSKTVKHINSANKKQDSFLTGPTLDLRAIVNACYYLRQKCDCAEAEQVYSSCIAFFRKQEMSRYIFYITAGKSIKESRTSIGQARISLYDHLRLENERNVTLCHRLMLALKLVKAVLQFHSSPWLEEEWSLAQLQLLSSQKSDSGDLSLYLNSRLPVQPLISDPETLPDSLTVSSNPELNRPLSPLSQAIHRGIDNITLFCLGIALIEIAHWRPLSELGTEYDQDQIDTARRVARGTTILGPWYDSAIQKCLRCDFAFGWDLNSEALQRAIYSDVVCPLEDLVVKLNGLTVGS